jgi:Ni/Co efflux regulator RcnB
MKKMIANVLALGILGAATAASAQDEQRRDDNARPGRPAAAGAAVQRRDVQSRTVTTTRRVDVTQFRRNVQSTQRFRAGFYRAPPGFVYRRWGFGQSLPAAYWGRDYWLPNFFAYGLFAPPTGLVWVRYGPDAMLIDQVTGEIIQVRYGVFY